MPLWVVLAIAVTGLALLLAALQVFVRDVEHVLMPVLMILMYLTPILYPLTLVPENAAAVGRRESVRLAGGRLRDALLDGTPRVRMGATRVARSLVARWRCFVRRDAAVFRRLSPHFEDFVVMRARSRRACLAEANAGRAALALDARRQGLRESRVARRSAAPRARPAARARRARTCSARSTASRSSCSAASRSASSARTAPASRRCSRSSRAWSSPRAAASRVNGRVGALLELGSGFHPDYTGLANIDLAAALLGLAPDEIAAKRDEIVAFADIGEHIDDPIKHYSSGMVVRLGFAVATALRRDILITDEVLAVGDESFQKKCVAWMERFLADGGTLLLCSHSMYHVQKLCRHALWLQATDASSATAPRRTSRRRISRITRRRAAAARRPVAPSRAAAAGVYAITSLDARARRIAGAGRDAHGARRGVLARWPRAGRAGRHRARRRHAGVRRGDRHGRRAPRRVAADRFAFALDAAATCRCCPGKYFVRAHALDPEGVRLFDHVERPLDRDRRDARARVRAPAASLELTGA